MLREMVRDFVSEFVEPQALEYDRDEKVQPRAVEVSRRNGTSRNHC